MEVIQKSLHKSKWNALKENIAGNSLLKIILGYYKKSSLQCLWTSQKRKIPNTNKAIMTSLPISKEPTALPYMETANTVVNVINLNFMLTVVIKNI